MKYIIFSVFCKINIFQFIKFVDSAYVVIINILLNIYLIYKLISYVLYYIS